MAKATGESIRSLLLNAAIIYAQFFGLFASYKLDRFVLGLVVPPVAWFDSIYYWFSPAEWEKHWDIKVEALSKVMFAQVGELGERQIEAEGQLRDWVSQIPETRKAQLRSKFHMFVEALADYTVELTLTKQEPRNSMDGFIEEPGLVRAWQQYKSVFDAALRAELTDTGAITARRERDVRKAMRLIVDVLNSKVDSWL